MNKSTWNVNLYLLNFALLSTHEIDAAFWKEWEMFFGAKEALGGIQGFLVFNFVLLVAALWGFRQLVIGAKSGYVLSLVLAAGGTLTFAIHGYYLLSGQPEFTLPVSLAVLVLILVVSLAQGFVAIRDLRAGAWLERSDSSEKYYPLGSLPLREDVPGARMWAVALEKTMLTYFEVQPHSRFESHSHESEQITLVLEGELFFEVGGRVVGVKAGEVIALPSDLPHAVFTREEAVKAVDAWSPVREKYRE